MTAKVSQNEKLMQKNVKPQSNHLFCWYEFLKVIECFKTQTSKSITNTTEQKK